MDRTNAKQEIRQHWREILQTMTEPAKTKVNGETSYVCPFCGHGKNGDGLTNNPRSGDGNGLKCFGCDFSGDIIDLYMKHTQTDFNQSFNDLAEKVGIRIDEDRSRSVSQSFYEPPVPPIEALEPPSIYTGATDGPGEALTVIVESDFTEYYKECQSRLSSPSAASYLMVRGISIETAASNGLGYDPDWISPTALRNGNKPSSSPRIIIPTTTTHYFARDIRGGLTSNAKKYSRMNEGSAGIFNLKALHNPDLAEIFITEGAFDALSIIEAGGQAIALNSTSNSSLLIRSLEKEPTKATLILCMDNDEAGEKARNLIQKELTRLNISHISTNICGTWKDPNEALQNDREAFIRTVKSAGLTAVRPDNVETYIDQLMADEIGRFKKVTYTGFENLDRESSGLYAGLYVMAAISSLGKTTFIHQMADQLAANGEDVLFFSLEQSRLELVSKSIARITAKNDLGSAVTSLSIRRGYIPEHVLNAVEAYKTAIGGRMSIIEGNFNCNVSFIADYARRYIEKTGCRPVIIIDYLQILQGSEQNQRQSTKEMIDGTVTELRRLSREHELTIIAISSVNRANYLTPIDFESLKESGGIEYTADVVWGLQLQCLNDEMFDQTNNIKKKREEVQKAKAAKPRKIELRCLKNRYGISNYSCFFDYFSANDLFIPTDGPEPEYAPIMSTPKAGRKR